MKVIDKYGRILTQSDGTAPTVVNETTGAVHQLRVLNNEDGVPTIFLGDANVSTCIGRFDQLLIKNVTTAKYDFLVETNNEDGLPVLSPVAGA